MEINTFFFDTYALLEIVGGNPKYFHLRDVQYSITFLNLLEFYYNLLAAGFSEEEARQWHKHLKENVVQVDDIDVYDAMKFRLENKKLDLSYADALGYIFAKRHGIPFVTGDKAFEHLDGVIFIKK